MTEPDFGGLCMADIIKANANTPLFRFDTCDQDHEQYQLEVQEVELDESEDMTIKEALIDSFGQR